MENEVNQILEDIYKSLEYSLPKKNAQVARAVDRTRLTIADILTKYTGSDGKVPPSSLNAILNEMEQLEGEIYRNLRTELQTVFEQTGEETTITLAEAIVAIIGLLVLFEAGKIPKAIMDLTVGVVEAVFSALTGSTYRKFTESATRSAFTRKEDDNLILNDRLRNVAATLRKDIETTLRQTISKGEGTVDILRKIDKHYKDVKWRLDTLVETETMYVMRQVVAKFAEVSGLVKALKIVDFPHGDPAVHKTHKCYIYAQADEHGLGKGIYPVGTRKIRNPHPRCRSALFFVLADDLK